MVQKVLVVTEYHAYEDEGLASLWVLPDLETVDDDSREFADMPEAVRIVGPTSPAECLVLEIKLVECLGKLGHKVRTGIAAGD